MGADVKEEVRKFGETVSVKGIPRIFKAQNTTIRALWLIAVLLSFGILVWQLTKVFVSYFGWPVQSVYKEGKGRPTFPDVTICNLYSNNEDINWDNYTAIIASKMNICTVENFREVTTLTSKDEYDYIWSLLGNINIYLNTSFPSSNNLFSDHLIMKSFYYNWDWDIASVAKHSSSVRDSDYGQCYTIQLNVSADRSNVQGLTTLLYIDNFPSTLDSTFYPTPTQSLATGVRVKVNSPGVRPNMKEGISVGPGTETTIRLSQTTRQRVQHPYGNCTVQQHADIMDNRSVTYTIDDCYSVCLQQTYIDECQCINSIFYYSPHQLEEVHGVVCGTTGAQNASSIEDFYQLVCVLQTEVNMDYCASRCAESCSELLYDLSVTSAPWPHPSVQLLFYDKYIAHSPHIFGDKFAAYGEISGKMKNKTLSDEEAISLLQKMDGLQNNFIQLNIFFQHYTPMVLKESSSITSDKMLSLIGGALSLWLGITVMTVIEFVQFIFDLMAAVQRKRAASVETDNCSKKG